MNRNRLDNKRIQKLFGQPQLITFKSIKQEERLPINPPKAKIQSLGFVCASPESSENSQIKQKKLKLEENHNNSRQTYKRNSLCFDENALNENSSTMDFASMSPLGGKQSLFMSHNPTTSLFEKTSLSMLFDDNLHSHITCEPLPQLISRMRNNEIDTNYFMKEYSPVNAWIRAQVINWIFRIAKAKNLDRNIVYIFTNSFDRYFAKITEKLSVISNESEKKGQLSTHEIQDLSLSILSVAMKQEQGAFRVSEILKVGSPDLTKQRLLQFEITILTKLEWRLNSVTNIQQLYLIMLGLQQFCFQTRKVIIKGANELKWLWWDRPVLGKVLVIRENIIEKANTWMDLMVLDAENLIYDQNGLCFGLLYILVGIDLKIIWPKYFSKMSETSKFLFQENDLNLLFKAFLHEYCMELSDLLGGLQYITSLLQFIDMNNEKEIDFLSIIKSKRRLQEQKSF